MAVLDTFTGQGDKGDAMNPEVEGPEDSFDLEGKLMPVQATDSQ